MDRRAVLAWMSCDTGSLLLPGCASFLRGRSVGPQCYRARNGPGIKAICTPEAVPDEEAESRAKRFEPVAGQLTIYLVRHRWGDAANRVKVGIAGERLVTTIPASLIRIAVPPGKHLLVFNWAKGHGVLQVQGDAGQVLFVDLVGSLWIWNEWYRLEMGDPSFRDRAMKSRLVADVKLGVRE